MKTVSFAVVAFVLMGIGVFVVITQGHICERGKTYQAVKYEPYFDKKGTPHFRPIYGCK